MAVLRTNSTSNVVVLRKVVNSPARLGPAMERVVMS
jgi:hypothetical protein